MNLLDEFQQNWKIHFAPLLLPKQKVMLALSGGADSTVLAYLLHQSGIPFVAAHVNYQLRGSESERDEAFVQSFCQTLNIPLFVKKIDTHLYVTQHQLSVQVAAREIRYQWFNEIRATNPDLAYSWVLTAHHANDSIETSMLHFFRGTGIDGLKGIPAINQSNKVIRPLLPFFRKQIEAFANENQIAFIVDSSNLSNHYTRNFFRNQLIPELESIFPAVQDNLLQNTHRFEETAILYQQGVQLQLKKLIEQKENEWHIPVLKWKKVNPLHTITWEIIQPFGFTAAQIPEVVKLLDGTNSSYVQSDSHRIIKNRQWMIIAPLANMQAHHIIIEGAGKTRFLAGELTLSLHDRAILPTALSGPTASNNALSVEWIDATKISFPLQLRHWAIGDYFYPLGMTKKKKVSKFLIDSRLSKTDKEKIWVLTADKKIIAIIGLRIDNRFKYSDSTKQLLKIEFKRN
ncbi:MAG: tRNA lysidine(34) synthetase TilS [Sediminibacterium sp.]|nr:MAG: tRNA lysidine(34) synthetase TilS [Sediminibacterium sp.] [Sediminibacterium sp. FEMGT703S]